MNICSRGLIKGGDYIVKRAKSNYMEKNMFNLKESISNSGQKSNYMRKNMLKERISNSGEEQFFIY